MTMHTLSGQWTVDSTGTGRYTKYSECVRIVKMARDLTMNSTYTAVEKNASTSRRSPYKYAYNVRDVLLVAACFLNEPLLEDRRPYRTMTLPCC